MLKTKLAVTLLLGASLSAQAEMTSMAEQEMSDVSGQGGVYLSGEFAINKDGGPLWENGERYRYTRDANGNLTPIQTDACDNGVCGLRFAIKLNESSEGWYVLDDLSGGFAFEGLTLRTKPAGEAMNYDYMPDGSTTYEPRLENVDDEVLVIGLPGTVSFNNFKFKYAVANNGEYGVPLADGTPFRQTDIIGVQLDGDITLKGNLLLFPVD